MSLHNYAAINSAISLGRSLIRFGDLHRWCHHLHHGLRSSSPDTRWRICSSEQDYRLALVLLVQVVPSQLLMIPLYVLIIPATTVWPTPTWA